MPRPPRLRPWQAPLLLVTLPSLLAVMVVVLATGASARLGVTMGVLVVVPALFAWYQLHERWEHPLRRLTNLVAAMREGDLSIRLRALDPDQPYSQTVSELNALADVLQERLTAARDAERLLIKVLGELDYGVFTVDPRGRIVLANAAMAQLLGRPLRLVEGQSLESLGLSDLVAYPGSTVIVREFPARSGRWLINRGETRVAGQGHAFIMLRDVSHALQASEVDAWKRLLRVLSHELNNSLTPLLPLTSHLRQLFHQDDLPDNWQEEARESLAIIHRRATHLQSFVARYAQLARLPVPQRVRVDIREVVSRIAALPWPVPVQVAAGPAVLLQIDPAQMEQVLINLTKNASEAVVDAAHPHGEVRLRWQTQADNLVLEIEDDGTGLSEPASIFVPFYSTKDGGSGIGLTLSRQILHAHGGRLELHNRQDAPGCLARVVLPLG